jgi:AAA+ superfamily predicted ATPase
VDTVSLRDLGSFLVGGRSSASRSTVETTTTGSVRGRTPCDEIRPVLQHLDRLLAKAVSAATAAYGPEAAGDLYRGLYVGTSEVGRLLARQPLVPPLGEHLSRVGEAAPALAHGRRFGRLGQAFGLTAFDLDILVIGLAPELDLRYERLYAFLQDDVSRRRPGVDLVLNLLCSNAEAKITRRAHFAADAPLRRHRLVHLVAEPAHVEPPLLSQSLKIDEQIIAFLVGQRSLDYRLAAFCRRVVPEHDLDGCSLEPETGRALEAMIVEAREAHRPLCLYFHGPEGAGKQATGAALAAAAGVPLVVADLSVALQCGADLDHGLPALVRQAELDGAVLYVRGLDELRGGDRHFDWRRLLREVAAAPGITILSAARRWVPVPGGPAGILVVDFAPPSPERRVHLWARRLEERGFELPGPGLKAVAERFRLTPSQIDDAAATASNRALWRAAARGAPRSEAALSADDLGGAARPHGGHELASLAQKIEAVYSWEDLVLPDDALAQLREICGRVAHRHRVLHEWQFGRKLPYGRGVSALFSGPSGTGKTMAAEIVAHEIDLDLYRIDLAQVVSKYIGETEKNLERVFSAAERTNAVLFFDEADALFGKRSEVRDAHDRYANIEIAYLLQRIERYEGLSILATNLRQNLDEAFLRRLQFIVDFPFPDDALRLRIWRGAWPPGAPVGPGVDLPLLARALRLTGGSIRNITLSAAYLAAADGGSITMDHVLSATRREMQKMGERMREEDLAPRRDDPGVPGSLADRD